MKTITSHKNPTNSPTTKDTPDIECSLFSSSHWHWSLPGIHISNHQEIFQEFQDQQVNHISYMCHSCYASLLCFHFFQIFQQNPPSPFFLVSAQRSLSDWWWWQKQKRSDDYRGDLLLRPVASQRVTKHTLRRWMGGGQSGRKVTKVPIDENKIRRGGTAGLGRRGGVTGNEGICL